MTPFPFDAHRVYVGGLAPPARRRGGVAWIGAVVAIVCLCLIVSVAVTTVFHRSERCLKILAQAQHQNSSAWIDACSR